MKKMGKWNETGVGRRVLALVLGIAFCGSALAASAPAGVIQTPLAPSASMPTSGTCGFEINMILAAGESVVDYNQAVHASSATTVGPFILGLMGQFTFAGSSGTFSVAEVDRSYTSASPAPTTTDSTLVTSGTFTVAPQKGTATVPGAVQMVLTMTAKNGTAAPGAGPVLLVIPVNGGNTLLVQVQDGSGGGVCQF